MERKRSASYALDEKPTESQAGTPPDNAQTHVPDAYGGSAASGDAVRDMQASGLLHHSSDSLPQSQKQQSSATAPSDSAQVASQNFEQKEQQEHDTGDAEQRRAMELLRSVDEDADSGGEVIVCSAPDADHENGGLDGFASSAADVSLDSQHQSAYQTLNSKGDGTPETPQAVGSAVGSSVAEATAPVDKMPNLATDDSYIAQLTIRAQENEREDVLKELASYPELEFLRHEYEKLHQALKISQKNELELKAKCMDLSSALQANALQVHAALKEASGEEETIKRLKRDLSASLIEVANGKAREAAETKAANQLRAQIEELYKRIDEEEQRSLQQNARLNELLQERDKLQSSLQELYTTQEQLQDRRAAADEEAKKRERLERQLKQNKAHFEQQQQELAKKQADLAQSEEQIAALQQQLTMTQQQVQQEVQESQEIQKRIAQTELRLNDQIYKNSRLKAANEEREAELKSKQEEIEKMRAEKERVVKLHELLKKKMQVLESDKRTLDEQATALKLETAASEREVDTLKQQAENDKRQIESLLRERDLLSKNLLNADATAKKHADHAKRQLTHCEHLEKEVDGFRRECQQLQQKVETLEAERDRYGHTLNKSNQKSGIVKVCIISLTGVVYGGSFALFRVVPSYRYLESLEQLKNEELRVADLQRSIGEQQSKLAAQKTLYEAVRSDRNLFSRNLIASLDEMTELKHKFKLMFQQVGQLKEEIKAKDAGLLKQHFEHRKITSENEKLKDDLGKAEKKLGSLEQIIAAQKQVQCALLASIAILAERDMLGTQLLKRNQELSLLYEKVRIQESTLAKGEAQYKERLKEIKEWSRQCLAFRRELRNLEGGVAEVESLKREVLQLQKELLQERTKVRALTEALATPMNVHRWRRLEGTDPAKVELVKKIQSLQKRLIAKTEEVIERDLQIQEREKLFVQLKDVRTKTKQLRAAVSELQVLHKEVTSKRDEIERLHKELEAVKRRYMEEKRNEAREQQKQQQLQQQTTEEVSRTDTFFSSSTFEFLTGNISGVQS
ncbi:hypothetical protein, conserved [Eimeria brunetti]|uniref:Cilia- and flagella-associated protein 58 central coiled coil domain-containing protein n=1 Tax=Eimeria brunetti TaxID=51314 RepID=U6LWL7_9EIME|nr:hypothetical protein, conserved [Eimeria brunetti]